MGHATKTQLLECEELKLKFAKDQRARWRCEGHNMLNLIKSMSGTISTMKISLSIDAGDIVRIDLNPTKGSETRKLGYCLVLER